MEPLSPILDNRKYQALLDESVARIRVHTPEYTNFNRSDPGMTLVEVFAFLAESVLYRANQIPERNRAKFLSLLGVHLQPGSSARGLIVINNEKGPLATETLNAGVEVSARQIPFRTERGLDVLPVEGRVFYKRSVALQDTTVEDYYRQLYASYFDPADSTSPTQPKFYQTVPLVLQGGKTGAFNEFGVNPGVDLSRDTVDSSLWIALLLRKADARPIQPGDPSPFDAARTALAGKTLSLGLVPWLDDNTRNLLPPRKPTANVAAAQLRFEIPAVPPNGKVHTAQGQLAPKYKSLPARAFVNVLEMPGTIELTLPSSSAELTLWNDLDPLEPGVDDLPPALDDTEVASRLITWVRVRAPKSTAAHVLWCGINATPIAQRSEIDNELVGTGTGEPDQSLQLANTPVLPDSVTLTITPAGAGTPAETWLPIDDLFAADSEVLTPDLRLAPGQQIARRAPPLINVFTLDAQNGLIRFGDGTHGRRPPFGCTIRANYAYSSGGAGNVAAGAVNQASQLPTFTVGNPIRTWGGADAETVSAGEKQIARYLQHRDRLVTAEDFDTIVRRTPGVQIGRLDVLPTYHPGSTATGGYAPGAVTLLLLPLHDPDHPDAPQPDRVFLDSVCDYVNDRRLVTTEVVLRGPDYVPIYCSIGLRLEDGTSASGAAEVREVVRTAVRNFLSPYSWRLNKSVLAIEISAVAARIPGVQAVTGALLAEVEGPDKPEVAIEGLQLPQLAGLSITVGDPVPIDEVRGALNPDAPTSGTGGTLAIPIVPEECT